MMKPGLLLLLLVAVRIPGLDDPLVGRYDERMNETAAIARNYHELEMNILYPRIDWGGNGPGYAEEAFQIYAYAVAVLYRVFGVSEYVGRALSLVAFVLTGTLTYLIGCRLFSEQAALIGLFFLGVSPLGIYYSYAFQPDFFGLLCTVAAVYFFQLWTDKGSRPAFVCSMIAATAAGLTKPPNLFIGIPLVYLAHRKFRWAFFKRADIWLYAVAVITLPAIWYWHAHLLGTSYGNIWGVIRGSQTFSPAFPI